LLQVERGWRDVKGALGLRPVFHHREDRIRAHVQLCWLALLLLRVVENATADTWRNVCYELDRMHLVNPCHHRRSSRATLRHHRRTEHHADRTRAPRAATLLRLHRPQRLTVLAPPHERV